MLGEIPLGTALLLVGGGAVLAGAVLLIIQRRRPQAGSGRAGALGPTDEFQFRDLLEVMQMGVTVTDSSGIIVYTNQADAAMHGYTPQELIGKPAGIFAPPTTRKTVVTGEVDQLRRWRREVYNLRKDGEIFPVRLRSDLIRDAEAVTNERVVILVDDYDKPILDNITDPTPRRVSVPATSLR